MIRKIIISMSLLAAIQTAYASEDEIEAGKILYRTYCTQCHGIEGDGYGINVADMEVLPRDHTDRKEMMTRTDKDLFKAIKHGGKSVDKSVLMPNWDGNLSDDQISALVQYLRSLCCTQKQK